MVMEHFAGGTVADRLRGAARIPRPLALRWLREAAIALDCAHDARRRPPRRQARQPAARRARPPRGRRLRDRDRRQRGVGHPDRPGARHRRLHLARAGPRRAPRPPPATATRSPSSPSSCSPGRGPSDVDHPAAQARAHVQADVPVASDVGADLPRAVDAVLRAGWRRIPTRARRAPRTSSTASRTRSARRPTAVVPPPTAQRRSTPSPPPSRAPPRPSAAAAARARPAPPSPTTGRAPPTSRPRRAAHDPAAGRRRPPPAARAGPRRWPAVAALAALLLVAGAVVAVAFTGGGSAAAGRRRRTPDRRTSRARSSTRRASHARRRAPTARSRTSSRDPGAEHARARRRRRPPPAGAASAGDPKASTTAGFALLQQGNPTAAVPLLQQSVHGFRTLGRTGEIDYAFALFNLGAALRAVGASRRRDPAARGAPPGLATTSAASCSSELALARAQAGQGGTAAPRAQGAGTGRGNGRHGNSGRGQGRRRRGLIPPAGRAIARAGHRDIPRSDDADLAHNSARLTVQGPRAAADSEEHRKDSDAHSQGHRAEARFRAPVGLRAARSPPPPPAIAALASSHEPRRLPPPRRRRSARRGCSAPRLPAPADATGGATDADDAARQRRRLAQAHGARQRSSVSGRSPPCGSGDGSRGPSSSSRGHQSRAVGAVLASRRAASSTSATRRDHVDEHA